MRCSRVEVNTSFKVWVQTQENTRYISNSCDCNARFMKKNQKTEMFQHFCTVDLAMSKIINLAKKGTKWASKYGIFSKKLPEKKQLFRGTRITVSIKACLAHWNMPQFKHSTEAIYYYCRFESTNNAFSNCYISETKKATR